MWWNNREEKDRVELLIGAHTQNIDTLPLKCYNTTQDKKKAREALIDEGKGT